MFGSMRDRSAHKPFSFYIALLLFAVVEGNPLAAHQPALPTISQISPAFGVVGSTVTATIRGSNLVGVSAISISGSGVTVVPLGGGTPESLIATISLASGAPLGSRSVTVAAIGGTSAPCKCFTVLDSKWTSTGLMKTARYWASSVVLQNGQVLLTGGIRDGQRLTSAELYDPSSGTWIGTSSMNSPRFLHTSVLLPDGRVFVIGSESLSAFAEIYDPMAQLWVRTSPMSTERGRPTATLLLNGKVLVAGGDIPNGQSSAEIYDPTTETWTPTFRMSTTRRGAVATLLLSGKVLVAGGGPVGFPSELFDPATLSWSITGSMLDVGQNASLATSLLPDGRVLAVFGGPTTGSSIVRTQLYDPTIGAWKRGADPLATYNSETLTLLRNGRVLLAGGESPVSPSAQLYDPSGQGTWSLESPMIFPRTYHTAVLLQDGRVLISGGTDSNSTPATGGEIYNPPELVPLNPSPTLLGVNPSSGAVGSSPIMVTVIGNDFVPNSVVQLNSTDLTTMFVNSTTLTTIIPAPNLNSPGTLRITVQTPSPGGGVSAAISFSVIAPALQQPSTKPLPIPEVEGGTTQSGYVILTPDSGTTPPLAFVTYGLVQNGVVMSKAGVLATTLSTTASAAVDVVGTINRNLGLAIANPDGAANTITLTLKDANGGIVGTPIPLPIDPYKQIPRFVDQLFPTGSLGPAFTGSINLQSATPFATVGLAFSGTAFNTVALGITSVGSPVPQRTQTAGNAADTPTPGIVGGVGSMIFPQFAFGGGWATQISVVNISGNTASGRIDIFDTEGRPLAIKLNGASVLKSTFTYSLPAGGTLILAPRDSNGQSPL